MKNLTILAFLLFPFFVNAQYGSEKRCHADLVLGFEYGDRILRDDPEIQDYEDGILSIRLGTNVHYPISYNLLLNTGIRIVSRRSTFEGQELNESQPVEVFRDFKTTEFDYFAEVPFTFRYVLNNFNPSSRLYVESGAQFNFYVFTFEKVDYQGSDEVVKELDRREGYNAFNLSSHASVGIEFDLQSGQKYFIQPVFRYQFLATQQNSDTQYYHVGVETGIRF